MDTPPEKCIEIAILVTPHFNIAATLNFIDPFRVANYLAGRTIYQWNFYSEKPDLVIASAGVSIATKPITELPSAPDFFVLSSSWTPERYRSKELTRRIQKVYQRGATLITLDTGAFLLADTKILAGKKATVHYEHIDALIEVFPNANVTEDLYTIDGTVCTCCGGAASIDLSLHFVRDHLGHSLANNVARYLFHHAVRSPQDPQNPKLIGPLGSTVPSVVRNAIQMMEEHLEEKISIPEICQAVKTSQRQLTRLFQTYVNKTPVQYYLDIRLDRARGLVTQTDLKFSEIAFASGFNSQIHFSRAYRTRFGKTPTKDRIEGRVPFEFRPWPMHNPNKA